MKKCYIAGKISDLPVEEYTIKFMQAAHYLEKCGFIPVNPVDLPHHHDRTWSSYMKEDLTEMLKCDTVFALSNWKDSRGATIEVNLAISLGLKVIYQCASTEAS